MLLLHWWKKTRQLWTNRNNVSCCTYNDLGKALDTVDNKLLLQKCDCSVSRKETDVLIESFLKNRRLYIQVGAQKFSLQLVETGVPQGSMLGPILFPICNNDIKSLHRETDLILYADHKAITTGSRNIELLNNNQLALKDTKDWINENMLVLNAEKTKNVLSMAYGIFSLKGNFLSISKNALSIFVAFSTGSEKSWNLKWSKFLENTWSQYCNMEFSSMTQFLKMC